jgi:RNA polymerase sigma-70 factor (ECF subfamily)
MSWLRLQGELGGGSLVVDSTGLPAVVGAWLAAMSAQPAESSAQAQARQEEADIRSDMPDVRASLAGDGEAYARLVRRYQAEISAYMWRFTRDRGQWEELVHEVFVEAYLSLRGYRGEAPLMHWLRRIATRVGYRWWKTKTRRQAETPLELHDWDQVASAESPDAAEAGAMVHAVLDRLPARDRLVLTLLYLEDCSVAQAAELAGWSQTMVKVQAFRARKKLKKLLEQGKHV